MEIVTWFTGAINGPITGVHGMLRLNETESKYLRPEIEEHIKNELEQGNISNEEAENILKQDKQNIRLSEDTLEKFKVTFNKLIIESLNIYLGRYTSELR